MEYWTRQDSRRLLQELNANVENIDAMVLGKYGDTMVPLLGHSTVNGIPVTKLMPKERVDAIVQRTRDGGLKLLIF